MARSNKLDLDKVGGHNPVRGVVHTVNGNNGYTVVVARPPQLILYTATFLFLGFLAILLIGVWIAQEGGMKWADPDPLNRAAMFNYHPLFMLAGLLYIHGIANLMYRLFPASNYLFLRLLHGTLQLTGLIFVGLALYAVHFFKEKDTKRRAITHYTSVHSWMGLTLLAIMGLQFVFGVLGLLLPGFSRRHREQYKQVHRFTGITIFILACGTALVGLDQLKPKAAILNCLALVVIVYAVNGIYILAKREFARASPAQAEEAMSDEAIPIMAASSHRQNDHMELE